MASILCIATVLILQQANGSLGATTADLLRATIGPDRTARVEALYLTISDDWQRLRFRAGLTHVRAPWRVPATPITVPTPVVVTGLQRHNPRKAPVPHRIVPSLHPLKPVISPPLPGEGIWTASVAPASRLHPLPLIAKAFIRPDPARPYAIATVLRFDLDFLALHLVAGITEPGGPAGKAGSGTIPLIDQQPGKLLAVINGGFKYADGAYGMAVQRTVLVPPITGAATIGILAGGQVVMGAWGHDPRLTLSNPHLVSWRQNGSLLIDHGVINPLAANDGAWGTTVLNSVYTWRSAIGLTRHHTLLYVAGNALSVSTLASVLRAAGATTGMEMDINPFWVRAFFYGRDPARHLTAAVLRPEMPGAGTDYLGSFSRDFLYLTRIPGRSRG